MARPCVTLPTLAATVLLLAARAPFALGFRASVRETVWGARLRAQAKAKMSNDDDALPSGSKGKGKGPAAKSAGKESSGFKGNDYSLRDVSATMVPEFDKIMKNTYLPHISVDRTNKGDYLPTGFKVSMVYEIHNPKLERLYNNYKKQVKKELAGFSAKKCQQGLAAPPRTQATKLKAKLSPDPCIQEAYLFHGGPTVALKNISENGFDIQRAGQKHGTLLGPGLYMADSSTKVDEYTVPEISQSTHRQERRFLFCKAVLGRSHVLYGTPQFEDTHKFLQNADYASTINWLKKDKRHSIMRDAEQKRPNPTFKEYAVFKAEALLPKYVVLYTRRGSVKPPSLPDSVGAEAKAVAPKVPPPPPPVGGAKARSTAPGGAKGGGRSPPRPKPPKQTKPKRAVRPRGGGGGRGGAGGGDDGRPPRPLAGPPPALSPPLGSAPPQAPGPLGMPQPPAGAPNPLGVVKEAAAKFSAVLR